MATTNKAVLLIRAFKAAQVALADVLPAFLDGSAIGATDDSIVAGSQTKLQTFVDKNDAYKKALEAIHLASPVTGVGYAEDLIVDNAQAYNRDAERLNKTVKCFGKTMPAVTP